MIDTRDTPFPKLSVALVDGVVEAIRLETAVRQLKHLAVMTAMIEQGCQQEPIPNMLGAKDGVVGPVVRQGNGAWGAR